MLRYFADPFIESLDVCLSVINVSSPISRVESTVATTIRPFFEIGSQSSSRIVLVSWTRLVTTNVIMARGVTRAALFATLHFERNSNSAKEYV
jgi:hypothetical protein